MTLDHISGGISAKCAIVTIAMALQMKEEMKFEV